MPPDETPVVIKVVITLVRRDDMTREEFLTYWREEHAPLAEALPRLRKYTTSEPVDPDAPVDGIAQLYYDDIEDLEASMDSPEARRVREDSPNYTDPEAGEQYVVRETVRLEAD